MLRVRRIIVFGFQVSYAEPLFQYVVGMGTWAVITTVPGTEFPMIMLPTSWMYDFDISHMSEDVEFNSVSMRKWPWRRSFASDGLRPEQHSS